MADTTLAKILAAFLLLIVGISLVVVAADSTNQVTDKSTKTETVNIAGARIVGGTINESYVFTLATVPSWRADYAECAPTSIVFKNSTGQTLTAVTDYVFTSPSTLTLKNTTNYANAGGNSTSAAYTYCQDGYMTVGWGRTALDTGIGLFGVALMLGAVGFMYSVFKDFGLA